MWMIRSVLGAAGASLFALAACAAGGPPASEGAPASGGGSPTISAIRDAGAGDDKHGVSHASVSPTGLDNGSEAVCKLPAENMCRAPGPDPASGRHAGPMCRVEQQPQS